MSTLQGMVEHCDACGDELELGQIGKCDSCQDGEFSFTWKCPECGHLTTDFVDDDGPFGEVYCDACMALAQRPDLSAEEVARWDSAIAALTDGEGKALGLSYV